MAEVIEKAILRAITTMRENLGEQLTVDDMARSAMFSKFHFTRIFQRVTGVSPVGSCPPSGYSARRSCCSPPHSTSPTSA